MTSMTSIPSSRCVRAFERSRVGVDVRAQTSRPSAAPTVVTDIYSLGVRARKRQDGPRVAMSLMHRACASTCASSATSLVDVELKLMHLRDAARSAAAGASARAATNAAAVESSEQTVRDIARTAAGRTRDELCAELARARRRADVAVEALQNASSRSRALERADALDDLADVAECVIAFASHGRDKALRAACGGVFVDTNRVAEAASRARRALECLTRLGASGYDATGDGDVERIIRQATSALEEYCNDVENALLNAFDDALHSVNAESMSKTVDALWAFQDGASVIARYVASRPMFISHDSIEECHIVRNVVERAVITGESDSHGETIYCAFYENIRAMLSREFSTNIAKAFGTRKHVVFSALVRRVAEQRVSDIIETLLSTELKTVDSLRQRLHFTSMTLSELEKSNRLIRQLTKGDTNVHLLMGEEFFDEACASLVDDECSCLDSMPTDDVVLSACGESSVDALCADYQAAVRRCATCLDARALERASTALAHTLLSRVLRLAKWCVNNAIAATTAASERFGATTTIEDANVRAFEPVLHMTRCVAAWLKRTRHVIGDSDAFDAVRDQLSRDMSIVFDAVAERVAGLVDAKLRAHQKSSDFLSTDAACFAERETDACKVVVSTLDGIAALAKRSLERANTDALLDAIAERFYASLFAHVRRFKYSVTGAVQLKLDLSAYVRWVRAHAEDEAIQRRFTTFAGRANVLVVGDDALDSLVRDLRDDGGVDSVHELEVLVNLRLTASPSITI